MWTAEKVDRANQTEISLSLERLANGTQAAMRIPGTYTPEEVDVLVGNICAEGVSWYPHCEFEQGRIGICATEYASKINGKEAYFLLQKEATKLKDRMFPGALDPVKKIIDIFSPAFDISVAQEESLDGAQYFTGLVRAMKRESTTHFDFAPNQLPGWQVSDAKTQFAVVTYLQLPGTGGQLEVFNRLWQPTDEVFNNDKLEKGPYGFSEKFLGGVASVEITPEPGETIIFNSRNFHKVKAMLGDAARLSINSFMTLSEDKLRIWN